MNLRRLPQLVGYWRLRRRRLATFRAALELLPHKSAAFTWWWDEVNARGLEAERKGQDEETAYWRGQKAALEWLLNGLPEGGRPTYKPRETKNA